MFRPVYNIRIVLISKLNITYIYIYKYNIYIMKLKMNTYI